MNEDWVNHYYKMFIELSEDAKHVPEVKEKEKEFRKRLDVYAKGWARLNYAEQGEVSFKINQHYRYNDENTSNNKNTDQ